MEISSALPFKIDRPLVFFDLETTGTNIQVDRIVELSVVKFQPGGKKDMRTRRINPEMPIPQEATAIHGISNADVADAPKFKDIASNFYLYLDDCDLAGFNIQRFDLLLLTEEFKRAGLAFDYSKKAIIDCQTIFHRKEPRTLSAAYKFYCGKELEAAHTAEGDVIATFEVLAGQIAKYQDLPKDIKGLHEFCTLREPNWVDTTGKFKWRGDDVIIAFGKNAGIPLRDMASSNPGFLNWMINASFPEDAIRIAKDALTGKFPEKPKDAK